MDPWSYWPDGKTVFFANDFDLSADSFAMIRKITPQWNQNHSLMSELSDRSFSERIPKPFHGKSTEFSSVDSTTELASSSSSSLSASDLLSQDYHSSSKIPSFRRQEFSGKDLRQRRPMDYYMNPPNEVFGNDKVAPAKTSRTASLCSQRQLCQVFGCNMDLSSSKEYHRRHRVCEAHSKTPMVLVNGREQRFCQQCSRFHLLEEFDDRKRSCRRRLRGHNERRRKPSVYYCPSKGTKFLETSQAKDSSLVLREPTSLVYRVVDAQNRLTWIVKFKDEHTYRPSIYPENAQNSGWDLGYDHLTKRYHLSDPMISSSEATVASAYDPELHEVPRSSCALSLLSARSHHVSGTPSASFSFMQAHEHKGPREDIAIGVHATTVIPKHNDQMESSTVDLFQLSSHLQRVEQQRNSTHVIW